jgi:hypothetical protein
MSVWCSFQRQLKATSSSNAPSMNINTAASCEARLAFVLIHATPQQVTAVPYATRPIARVGFNRSWLVIMNTVIPFYN